MSKDMQEAQSISDGFALLDEAMHMYFSEEPTVNEAALFCDLFNAGCSPDAAAAVVSQGIGWSELMIAKKVADKLKTFH